MTQRTLVLLKPDAVRRGLTGEIISRIERKAGWQITALELRSLDQDTLEQHYGEHKGKPFYEPLVEFMSSGPVVAMIVEGERVVEGVRALAGPTDPIAAAPGSIRGDYGVIVRENLIHASDSEESAEREVKIFFGSCLTYRQLIIPPVQGGRTHPAALSHRRCRSGERVPPMDRLHKRGGTPSADNGEDPRAVFVQARLRWKPSRHSTHLAVPEMPSKAPREGQTNPDGELNVVHRP